MRKLVSLFVLTGLVFSAFVTPRLVQAVGGTLGRIEVERTLNGATSTVVVFSSSGGWQYRTVHYDDGYGVKVTVYASGGSADWLYGLRSNRGFTQTATIASTFKDFYPGPLIDGDYSASVDGHDSGTFYVRGYYPDLVASTPRPNDGPAMPRSCVGDTINWYVTVTNQGNGTAGPTRLYYYLGASPDDFSNYIASNDVGTLYPPGIGTDTFVGDYAYTFSSNDLGTRYLNAGADAANEAREIHEENNTNSYGPFVVIKAPGPVSLASPNDRSIACSHPTFSWSSLSGATGYHIQIDNNDDFGSPERDQRLGDSVLSYTPSPALSTGTWYWRVRATNACGDGSWSVPRSVKYAAKPGVPALKSPSHNSSTCDTTPDFSWYVVTGAEQYAFEIDNDSSFGSPVYSRTQSGASLTLPPITPGIYYWHVRAGNTCGWSNYATYRQLTIGGPPGPPSPSSPGNLTSMCPLSPTFQWDGVSGATNYLLQVDEHSDFASPLISETHLLTNTYTAASSLPRGPIYWRIASQGTCGIGPWTDSWQVDLHDKPAQPSLSSPETGAGLCSLAPAFAWEAALEADTYQYQLGSDSDYSSLLVDQTASGISYTIPIQSPGSYYWRIRSHNQCGDSSWSPSRQVTLHDPVLRADFTANPRTGNVPLSVTFSSLASGEIDSWLWNFGNGTSTSITPTHLYTSPGSFDVSLAVTGTCGNSVELKQDYVLVTDFPPVISERRVSNVRDMSFTVSWLTDLASDGHFEYGTTPSLGQVADDVRGASFSGQTHYIQIANLQPSTVYYYDLVSGSTRDDNSGQHYVTTGTTLALPGSDSVYGRVFRSGGSSPAEGAIVFVTLRDRDGSGSLGSAALLSSLVDAGGYWYNHLGKARLYDLGGYFHYSLDGDQLFLEARGGSMGNTCIYIDTGNDTPAPDMVLGAPCNPESKVYLPIVLRSP